MLLNVSKILCYLKPSLNFTECFKAFNEWMYWMLQNNEFYWISQPRSRLIISIKQAADFMTHDLLFWIWICLRFSVHLNISLNACFGIWTLTQMILYSNTRLENAVRINENSVKFSKLINVVVKCSSICIICIIQKCNEFQKYSSKMQLIYTYSNT